MNYIEQLAKTIASGRKPCVYCGKPLKDKSERFHQKCLEEKQKKTYQQIIKGQKKVLFNEV